MNLCLPDPPRHALVRSFWLLLSMLAGVGAALLAGLWGWREALLSGVLAAGAFGLVVFLSEPLAVRCYLAWNRQLVLPFTRLARRIVTAVCYFIVFAVVGRTGSRLPVAGSGGGGSLWEKCRSRGPVVQSVPDVGSKDPGWSWRYVVWAYRSGNTWAIVLIPFLALLWFCSTPEQRSLNSNIYTLF